MKKYIYWVLFIYSIFVASHAALAKSESKVDEFIPLFLRPVSNINTYISTATDDTRSISASMDLAVLDKYRIFGSVTNSAVSSSDLFYDAISQVFGVGTDPMCMLEASLEFEFLKVDEHFSTDGTFIKLGLNLGEWSVVGGYGERSIKQHFIPVIIRDPFEISALRRQIEIGYYGLNRWMFLVRHEEHAYDRIMSRLLEPAISTSFTTTSNAMSSALINQAQELEVGYGFRNWSVGIVYSVAESALDESLSQTTSVRYYQAWKDSVATTVTVGTSTQDITSDTIEFLELGLSFSWR